MSSVYCKIIFAVPPRLPIDNSKQRNTDKHSDSDSDTFDTIRSSELLNLWAKVEAFNSSLWKPCIFPYNSCYIKHFDVHATRIQFPDRYVKNTLDRNWYKCKAN